jgi:hypothetical protein
MAGSVVDNEAGRLVHHHDVLVLVDNREDHKRIGNRNVGRQGGNVDLQEVTLDQGPTTGLHSKASDSDPALRNHLGDLTPGPADQ